jgi:uncharacterized membrane protein HdeD (DUF308 family)
MSNTSHPSETHSLMTARGLVRKHWGVFLAEGILLLILGIAAVALPAVATLTFTIVLAWLFLISGGAGLATTFMMRGAPGFWWSLLSALLAIAAGAVLLTSPAGGVLSLTLLLVAFFIIEGVISIMYALDHRRELSSGWVWMALSGVIDLGLAAMIFAGLPGSAAWAIGLLVGINMIFGGVALIALALGAKSAV